MVEPADVKIAVLQVALGIKSLEDKELFEKLEEFWLTAYARGRADAHPVAKVGCKNFAPRGGLFCGNCGYHHDEH
jgi:hypothetical protein